MHVIRSATLKPGATVDSIAEGHSAEIDPEKKRLIRGKALMIHGGTDDYKTQPTGNAGNRQACAVIE